MQPRETFQELIERQETWTLPQELRRRAAERPDTAVLQFEDGPTCTYRELEQRVEAFAANLFGL